MKIGTQKNYIMKHLLTFLAISCSSLCYAQQTKTDTTIDNHLVFGEGFSFSLKAPKGWIGDIENAANYNANIILYTSKNELLNGGAIIQAQAFSKNDENTNEDLAYDISSYKNEYPALKEQNLVAKHKTYKTYSKLIFVDNNFFQYITYINPGIEFHKGVSIAMNIAKVPATEEELAAYKQIVNSMIMIIGN